MAPHHVIDINMSFDKIRVPSQNFILFPYFDAILLERRISTALKFLADAKIARLNYHLREILANLDYDEVESDIPPEERRYIRDIVGLVVWHLHTGMTCYVIEKALQQLLDFVVDLQFKQGNEAIATGEAEMLVKGTFDLKDIEQQMAIPN
jgi:hypothetical protein